MFITALIIVSIMVFIALFLIIKHGIASAREQGELEKEIEYARRTNELQKDYDVIASRPSASADAILKRMRKSPPANQ